MSEPLHGHLENRIRRARVALDLYFASHDDHTGIVCGKNLDGHDCCYTCNDAEALARLIGDWKPIDEEDGE